MITWLEGRGQLTLLWAILLHDYGTEPIESRGCVALTALRAVEQPCDCTSPCSDDTLSAGVHVSHDVRL